MTPRPDHRDPSMPVITRLWDMVLKKPVDVPITPETRSEIAKDSLNNSAEPHFSIDPTYNIRRTNAKLAPKTTRYR